MSVKLQNSIQISFYWLQCRDINAL